MKITIKSTILILASLLSLFFVLSYDGISEKEDNSIEKKPANTGTIDLGIKQLPAANVIEKKLVIKDVMKPSSEQVESHEEDVEVGENIGDDIFLPPLAESSSDLSTETEQIKLNVKGNKSSKELSYREKLALQEVEFYRKMYLNQKNSDMKINVKRNIQVQNRDKVVLRSDLLPEQPASQNEVIDDSLTYLVIINGEPTTLSGKEYRAYLNSQNSNQQVNKQKVEDYSIESGVDDFLNNIKPEPIKPRKAEQSDDDIPSLEALMD